MRGGALVPWALRGLQNGVLTSRYPARPDRYEAGFPAAVDVVGPAGDGAVDLPSLCPTDAIMVSRTGAVSLDRGRCILCGFCVQARPDVFVWSAGSDTARHSPGALVVPEGDESEAELARVRAALAARTRPLRRSVHIRHVDAGSDGSDEWEVLALLNPVYDVHRLGIFFTASPRHADILMITGAGARGMTAPLARTLAAMAAPTVVIAAGTDAISGGIVSPSYATNGGVMTLLAVDVVVPGSPPTPFALLNGILLALDRLPARARRPRVDP